MQYILGLTRHRYDRLFRLPSTGLDNLKSALRTGGAKEVALAEGKPKGRFAGVLEILDTEPGLLYDTRGSKANPSDLVRSMQITIEKGLVSGKEVDLVVNLGAEDLVQPLVGLDDEGVPVANDTFQKLMVYHERGLGNAAVLGRAFLEKVSKPDILFVPRITTNPKKKLYLFVDYEKDVFYLGHLDQESRYQPAISSGTCGTAGKPANHFGWWG